MHPSFDPDDHLRLMAQDRDIHLERARLRRIAAARAELARHQQRVDDAWRDLVAAMESVDGARRALVVLDRA